MVAWTLACPVAWTVACTAALWSRGALAAPLSWVSPVGDGADVAPGALFDAALVRLEGERLLPVGPVTVVGARARAATDALFVPVRVRAPSSGTLTVVATGGDDEARLVLAVAPLEELAVTVDPPQATKVDGTTPPITVRVVGGANGVVPRLHASSGTLSALVQDAPGRWHASYRPSGTRYPEVVILTTARPWPHEGSPAFALAHAVLPLSSSIVLPGETRPAVDVKVDIAGATFGPVRSDERGRFAVPVVVPPGIGAAAGTSVDRLGTRRVTPIDLHLPPTNRVAIAAFPTALVAGEDAEGSIAVIVVDKTGAPARETPQVKARRGKVGDLRALTGGRFVARYQPPASPGADVVEARLGDRSLATVAITVRAGAPVAVQASARATLLVAPSNERAELAVEARDAHGAVVDDAIITARATHGGTAVERGPTGQRVWYAPPASASPWRDDVRVHARAAAGTLAAAVALGALGDGTPAVLAVDVVGRPVPKALVRIATGGAVRANAEGVLPVPVAPGRFTFYVEGNAVPVPLLIGRAPDGALVGWPRQPAVRAALVAIDLMEPTPVDVQVERGEDGALVWRVVGGGAGERRVLVTRPGRPPIAGGRSGVLAIAPHERALPCTVTDVESGVAAVLTP